MTPLPFTDYSHFPILLGKTVYSGFKQKPVILAATSLSSVMNGFIVWHVLGGSASLPFQCMSTFFFLNLCFSAWMYMLNGNL